MRISDWSSDVCSSDLIAHPQRAPGEQASSHGDQEKPDHGLHDGLPAELETGRAPATEGSPCAVRRRYESVTLRSEVYAAGARTGRFTDASRQGRSVR